MLSRAQVRRDGLLLREGSRGLLDGISFVGRRTARTYSQHIAEAEAVPVQAPEYVDPREDDRGRSYQPVEEEPGEANEVALMRAQQTQNRLQGARKDDVIKGCDDDVSKE